MKERIRQIIDFYELNVYSFSVKIGVSEGTIRRFLSDKNGLSVETLQKISNIYSEINLDWLITGRGSMLISQKTEPEKPQPAAPDLHLNAEIDKLKAICAEKDARISDLQERIESQRHFLDMLSELPSRPRGPVRKNAQ